MAESIPPPDGPPDDPPDDHPARRPVFERPFLWLAILVAGVVVAVSLSFIAEKTDVSGTPGDVGHYCQQVAVIKRTTPTALGNGAPGNTDEAAAFVLGLTSLERVAPDNVRPDVHEVLTAAKDVYAALMVADLDDPASARALTLTVQKAEARSEDAIDQMKEYTQEACGVDLSPAPTTTTTVAPTTTTTVGRSTPTTATR
jgi:hypothetical protein